MEHVMVPVPQELEEQVRHFLAWKETTGSLAGWSEEAVAALYEELDDASRLALEMTARGVHDAEPVTVGGIASAAGLTTREILGIVVELAQRLRALGGPGIPLVVFDPPEGKGGDNRPVTMPRDGARAVLAIAEPG
jgi:hypothetical protein